MLGISRKRRRAATQAVPPEQPRNVFAVLQGTGEKMHQMGTLRYSGEGLRRAVCQLEIAVEGGKEIE